MTQPGSSGDAAELPIEDAEQDYLELLAAARRAAALVVQTPQPGLRGAALFIHRASQELLAALPELPAPPSSQHAVFECLRRLAAAWPDIASQRLEGERVFSEEPWLWKRAMTEWPMGGFARMAADFLIARRLLEGRVVELGAGVGSCSALVADHVTSRFIRTDLHPFLLKRQKLPGTIEGYDFNEPAPWVELDSVFAVNALHCAKDKRRTLGHVFDMLRSGGTLVLAEGNPHTDERATPWALNPLFGLFRGWWDVGGFVPRDTWLAELERAGFSEVGSIARRAGRHDLGGLIWAVK